MRRLLAGTLLGLCGGLAQAQQLPPPTVGVHLDLTLEQTKLIVDVLQSVGCQNVAQLMVCNKAAELLGAIREQAKAQVK